MRSTYIDLSGTCKPYTVYLKCPCWIPLLVFVFPLWTKIPQHSFEIPNPSCYREGLISSSLPKYDASYMHPYKLCCTELRSFAGSIVWVLTFCSVVFFQGPTQRQGRFVCAWVSGKGYFLYQREILLWFRKKISPRDHDQTLRERHIWIQVGRTIWTEYCNMRTFSGRGWRIPLHPGKWIRKLFIHFSCWIEGEKIVKKFLIPCLNARYFMSHHDMNLFKDFLRDEEKANSTLPGWGVP